MGTAAALVVIVTGLDDGALTSLDSALERALGTTDAVQVQAVAQLPRDVDALEMAAARGATAIVEIEAQADLARADVRVCAVERGALCQSRNLTFSAADLLADRERSVAIVAVAMLPESSRRVDESWRGTSSGPPRPLASPSPPSPPSPPPPRYQGELTFAAAVGQPTALGTTVAGRVRVAGPLSIRAATGIRGGALPGIDGSTLEIPLALGVDVRWPLGPRVALGARLDGKVQARWVSVSAATPSTRQRWLAAAVLGPELHVRIGRHVGLLLHVGLELGAGTTYLERQSGPRATLGLARGYCEVGPYLTF